jgi:hypothetical protein
MDRDSGLSIDKAGTGYAKGKDIAPLSMPPGSRFGLTEPAGLTI